MHNKLPGWTNIKAVIQNSEMKKSYVTSIGTWDGLTNMMQKHLCVIVRAVINVNILLAPSKAAVKSADEIPLLRGKEALTPSRYEISEINSFKPAETLSHNLCKRNKELAINICRLVGHHNIIRLLFPCTRILSLTSKICLRSAATHTAMIKHHARSWVAALF